MEKETYVLAALSVAAIGGLIYVSYRNKTDEDVSANDSSSSDSASDATDNASNAPETPVDFISKIGSDVVSTIRGIRNNNPGNIKYSSANNWVGQTGQDSNGFATFDSEADGIRAIGVILKNYQSKYSLNTVDALIRRWSATDQDAYVTNVANYLGVDPYESVDTSDENTLVSLIQGIITQEDGYLAEVALNASGSIDTGAKNA